LFGTKEYTIQKSFGVQNSKDKKSLGVYGFRLRIGGTYKITKHFTFGYELQRSACLVKDENFNTERSYDFGILLKYRIIHK